MSHSAEKIGKGALLLWNVFVFYVRGFGCVQNHVLSTHGKSAHCAQIVDHSVTLAKKLVPVIVGLFYRKKAPTKNTTASSYSRGMKKLEEQVCN